MKVDRKSPPARVWNEEAQKYVSIYSIEEDEHQYLRYLLLNKSNRVEQKRVERLRLAEEFHQKIMSSDQSLSLTADTQKKFPTWELFKQHWIDNLGGTPVDEDIVIYGYQIRWKDSEEPTEEELKKFKVISSQTKNRGFNKDLIKGKSSSIFTYGNKQKE
ncbi:MAG: hypothetical protein CMB80_05570 [Flammeovirgaceae bacterium]|nr:hypothetical protein [Flammeovirgaceae bacterium]|tara:strand:+ start:13395 stop:13874 length:480 start_codon:yes stop_codon:yes gene_type:complete